MHSSYMSISYVSGLNCALMIAVVVVALIAVVIKRQAREAAAAALNKQCQESVITHHA